MYATVKIRTEIEKAAGSSPRLKRKTLAFLGFKFQLSRVEQIQTQIQLHPFTQHISTTRQGERTET